METILATSLSLLSLFPPDASLCVYFAQNPLSHLLCFATLPHAELFSLLFSSPRPRLNALYLSASVSLAPFHPSLPSSAGWLIVTPQLRG